MDFDRIVVGGGLFGSYSAWVLARRGYSVALIERDSDLMQRATLVNQARLHSGLHYPRSLLTATESLRHYQTFKEAFPDVVREDFTKVYAVSRDQSKTSAAGFRRFLDRLGQQAEEVDPERWFRPGVASLAVKVQEGSFDAARLRTTMQDRLEAQPGVTIMTGTAVTSGHPLPGEVHLRLSTGQTVTAGGVVIAGYAGINPLRRALGLDPLHLKHELTEVLLCRVADPYRNLGITVMDGPFWSFMPFGWTDLVSLTSVSLTPVMAHSDTPEFPCQDTPGSGCTPDDLQLCTTCPARPASLWRHQFQQTTRMLKDTSAFEYVSSMWTVKTLLSTTEVDDARPTFVQREDSTPIWTVFSGKISTVLDLEGEYL